MKKTLLVVRSISISKLIPASLVILVFAVSGVAFFVHGRSDPSPSPTSHAATIGNAEVIFDRFAYKEPLVQHYRTAGCYLGGLFDQNGVVQVDYGGDRGRRYNPVTVSQYAIGCRENWKTTDDIKYREIYLRQIDYLRTKYIRIDDDHVAYEYDFPAGFGVEAGWRSGLAQAQAISALVRYFYDTQDHSVLDLIQDVKRYMMLPVTEGGVVVTSPEGLVWIEEYPSSPPSFVLNGFISAVFGLYEYVRLFPDDEAAQRELEQAIVSIKRSIPHYDTGNWAILDRFEGIFGGANDDYMAGYIYQAQSLWQLTGDPFFNYVHMRWASFYYDVHKRMRGRLIPGDDSSFQISDGLEALVPQENVLRSSVRRSSSVELMQGYGLDTLLDSNWFTYMAPSENGDAFVEFELDKPRRANALALGLYNVSLYPGDIILEIQEESGGQYRQVDTSIGVSRRFITLYFDEKKISGLRLRTFDHKGQERLILAEVVAGVTAKPKPVMEPYASYLGSPIPVRGRPLSVSISAVAASRADIMIMYRKAGTEADLGAARWEWLPIIPVFEGCDGQLLECSALELTESSPAIVQTDMTFYQFRVLATLNQIERGLSALRVEYSS